MSSDAFADLARTVGIFADSLRGLLDRNGLPARGSPAAAEIDSEPFAGEWGQLPSATAFAIVLLTAAACADHLAGVSAVIGTRHTTFAPYVLTRAAAEAASVCCYVADPAADARERLRRSMNLRLDAMCERLVMLRSVTSLDAASEIIPTEERVATFGRAAVTHGFVFRKDGGKGRPAHLDDKLPSAMTLMDGCASDTPGLGIAYQRLLSAVTHGKLHGLSRFLMAADAPAQMASRR